MFKVRNHVFSILRDDVRRKQIASLLMVSLVRTKIMHRGTWTGKEERVKMKLTKKVATISDKSVLCMVPGLFDFKSLLNPLSKLFCFYVRVIFKPAVDIENKVNGR